MSANNIEGQLHGYLQEHNVEALLKDIVVQVRLKQPPLFPPPFSLPLARARSRGKRRGCRVSAARPPLVLWREGSPKGRGATFSAFSP